MTRTRRGTLPLRAARVLRDWRTKALLRKIISALPHGQQLNYLPQRCVTHGVPIDDAPAGHLGREDPLPHLQHIVLQEVTGWAQVKFPYGG